MSFIFYSPAIDKRPATKGSGAARLATTYYYYYNIIVYMASYAVMAT